MWLYFIIGGVVFFGLIFWVNGRRGKISIEDQQKMQIYWAKVVNLVEINPKEALLEADKLLDVALKIKGFHGSLGEKLKRAGPLFSHRNEVWQAHKMRNRLAHELDVKVSLVEVKVFLSYFKQALNDLGIRL
ncbi:TPA: hypothetical protein DGH83_02325 [Candidatus Peregrinibacteria bacterium]|nr:hypothetical protein [Candidatus Peregrinibacteria bacterium]